MYLVSIVVTKMGYSNLSKRQYLTILSFALAQFFNAICISLQAPFFPQEAEKKGATATEYGCVFGVFELVVFLVSPWYGKHVGSIGPEKMFFGGIIMSAICSILFGFLDKIDGHLLFISLAFLIRIIEALGNAACVTAGFAIIAHEFPDNVASTFASLETFFGLGLIAGPTLGGVLYQLGGFTVPFVTLGVFLFICAVLTKITLPSLDGYQKTEPNTDSLWKIFRLKGMVICVGTIVSTTIGISFVSATLEPHIRMFNLNAVQVGFVFIVSGAVYAVTAPAWGWLCDSKYIKPIAVSILGGIIQIAGISLLGPVPFLPLHPSLLYVIFGLVLHGLSIGARLVSSFTSALQLAIGGGMPNAIQTYGIISALWTSSVAFGSFLGPTVSGYLYDQFQFARASIFIIVLTFIMILFEFWSLLHSPPTKPDSPEYETVDPLEPVSTTNLNALKHTSAFKETYPVGLGSTRVLNLVYTSNPDMMEESNPLLSEKGPKHRLQSQP